MMPRSWLRKSRRRSVDSIISVSSSGLSSDDSVNGDLPIPHTPEFLDDHLPVEYFKQDVIRLIHQLRIPGWSMVNFDMAFELQVSRISGALTNSVYSVKCPQFIKEMIQKENSGRPYHNKLPPNLLLRVYGPQVGLLVDREKELQTVAELTKHNIGPRLLGTFQNGRFEQFLNANPLTKDDLRHPDTSIQIAKRMSDLHRNVPLSAEDIEIGPCVWQKIDKWTPVARQQLQRFESRNPGTLQRVLHRRSFDEFVQAIEKYKKYIIQRFNDEPVFCHNDTQYGNILRLEPPRGSPLLKPQHEHRQLVVIDFEYSGPNSNAFDIANHFCEWMSDYHHPTRSHHIWLDRFPNIDEQRRFITSYVEHGAQVFDENKMNAEIDYLMKASSDWRPAVSAFWAMWGIVQTPIEADQQARDKMLDQNPDYWLSNSPAENMDPEEDDLFDYLSYSSEKMALFWEDVEKLNLQS